MQPPAPRTPFGLGFRQPSQPEPPEETTAGEPASPNPDPLQLDGDGELVSEHDEMPDASSAPSAGTRSRASTPVSDGLRDFFRNGVIIASNQAHTFVGSRTPGQRQVELFQADRDDAENIGDPLSRIAARRDGVGEMSPDSADLLAAMMGLAGYAAKQLERQQIARKLDERLAGGLEQAQPGEHPADAA